MQRSSSNAGTITETDGSVTSAPRVPAPDVGAVLVWHMLRSELVPVNAVHEPPPDAVGSMQLSRDFLVLNYPGCPFDQGGCRPIATLRGTLSARNAHVVASKDDLHA